MITAGKVIRLTLATLPLLAGVPYAVYALSQSFLEGLHLTPVLHVFGWFLYWGIGAHVVLGAAGIALFTLGITRKSEEAKKEFGKTLATLALSMVVPGIMLAFVSDAFFWGRDRAYANLDKPRLMKSCAEIARLGVTATQSGTSDTMSIQRGQPEYLLLPEYIRKLHPLSVYVRDGVVILHMDGGGIMDHEGVLVVPGMPTARFARLCERHHLHLLDPNCSVARYQIDSSWTLFDFVRADAEAKSPQTGQGSKTISDAQGSQE